MTLPEKHKNINWFPTLVMVDNQFQNQVNQVNQVKNVCLFVCLFVYFKFVLSVDRKWNLVVRKWNLVVVFVVVVLVVIR